jgi:hypothetical protein
MSVIIPNNNPYVVQKETAQANSLDVDVKKLNLESAEITKTLVVLSVTHPSYAALQARQSAIQTAIKNRDQ